MQMVELIAEYGKIFLSIAFFLYVIVVTITILLDNRPPVVSLAWLVTLFFLPYFGIIIYIYAGVNWRKKKIMRQLPEDFLQDNLSKILEEQMEYLDRIRNSCDNDLEKCMTLLLGSNHSVITYRNAIKLYHSGKEFFPRLIRDLERAEHSIHMQFFIWRSDSLGEQLKELLLQKVREGVEVKLIFDGVGCFFKMSRKYKKALRQGGVEYRYFLDPLNPLSGRLVNYRNHRKIIVIDGKIGYTGGMNMAEEYISGGKRFESWRDTGIRLEYDAVKMLQVIFLTDWYNSGGALALRKEYFPDVPVPASSPQLTLQIAASGPDSRWHSIKQLIFTMINNANKEVLIQTPYFIPDETIMSAMQTAALSGVKVRLMMTGVPDKRTPLWVAHTYFESLLDAGVEIYQYTAGFFHPKVMVVDRRFATAGTCNMDVRSFHLDYEVNLGIFDEEAARELADQFSLDMEHCRQLSLEELRDYPAVFRFRDSLLRILAPLL